MAAIRMAGVVSVGKCQFAERAPQDSRSVVHNCRVNSSTPPPQRGRLFDPHLIGTLCGLASAVAYTGANSFLRSVDHCDPFWVSAVKALPTAAAMTPVIILLK